MAAGFGSTAVAAMIGLADGGQIDQTDVGDYSVFSSALVVVVLVLGTASSALAECLAQSNETSAIVEAINRAIGCKASFYVMRACRNNGARDVDLAAIVVKKCESTFLSDSTSDQLTLYEKERMSCAIKYGKMEGIIYASYRAMCEAVAALRLAQ